MNPDFISAKVMREQFDGNVFPCMGCRSFLSPWKDKNGNYKFYGRFNRGVVTLNLVDAALSSKGSEERFWEILDERLELCKEALILRDGLIRNANPTVSPIHWMYGALSRLEKNTTYNHLLDGGYSSISLGYIGIHEMVKVMKGTSNTTPVGEEFALRVMDYLEAKTIEWRNIKGLHGCSLYGTPSESLTYKFAQKTAKRFGEIKGITDKDYFTNSYHVNVLEPIDAFSKLKNESQFQALSTGGAISYVEVPNMQNNISAVLEVMKYIYNNIMYAELNTKSDYCQCCGFDGEIQIQENEHKKLLWTCPSCGNQDHAKMNIARRVCGYISTNDMNQGRIQEIKERVLHL
jgi:ribonucleoside-triphosphate reductase